MKTATGLGIAALIISVVSLFIPIYGIYLGGIALIIAAVAGLLGDKGLTIATVVVSFVGYFFLTPSLSLAEQGEPGSTHGIWIVIYALLAIPVVCMFISSTNSPKTKDD
jgi:hypothetical protein